MHEDCRAVVIGVECQPGPDLECMDVDEPDRSGSPMVRRRKRLSLFQSAFTDIGTGVGGIDCGYSKDELEYVACRGAGLGCRTEPYEYSDDEASVLSRVRAGSMKPVSIGLSMGTQAYEVAGPAHRFVSNRSVGSTSGRE